MTAAALVLAGAAAAGLYLSAINSSAAKIRTVARTFAIATDRLDYPRLLGTLCAQEAAAITEDDDYDPAAEPVEASTPNNPVVTNVQVNDEGGTATAQVALPGRSPVTIHLRPRGRTLDSLPPLTGRAPQSK